MDNVPQYGPALFPTLKEIRNRLERAALKPRTRPERRLRGESTPPDRERPSGTARNR